MLLAEGGWPALPAVDDTALLMLVSSRSPGVLLDEVTYRYRRHDAQLSRTDEWARTARSSWIALVLEVIELRGGKVGW